MSCPAVDGKPELTLSFEGATLSLSDADTSASLPAALELDPTRTLFGIRASGAMKALMPDLAAMDACVKGKLTEQAMPATDADIVGYNINSCRLRLPKLPDTQEVQAELSVTSFEPKVAQLYVANAYIAPSSVTGKPLRIDEWPIRDCVVQSGP